MRREQDWNDVEERGIFMTFLIWESHFYIAYSILV